MEPSRLLGSGRSTEDDKAEYPCIMCKKDCRWDQHSIACDSCDQWVHRKCMGYTIFDYYQLATSDDPWVCPMCDQLPLSTLEKRNKRGGSNKNSVKRGRKWTRKRHRSSEAHVDYFFEDMMEAEKQQEEDCCPVSASGTLPVSSSPQSNSFSASASSSSLDPSPAPSESALSGGASSDSAKPSEESSKSADSTCCSSKSTDAGGQLKSKGTKRRQKKDVDGNSVPAKKAKVRKKRGSGLSKAGPVTCKQGERGQTLASSCSAPGETDDREGSVWSKLGVLKCDKCGFTTDEDGLFSCHICNVKKSARRSLSDRLKSSDGAPQAFSVDSEPVLSAAESTCNLVSQPVAESPKANNAPSPDQRSEMKTIQPQAVMPAASSSQTAVQSDPQGGENEQRRGFIQYNERTQKFVCMQCNYSAAQGNGLIEHLLYQTSEKPYICRLCKEGFPSRAVIQAHFAQMHEGEKVECELHRVKEMKKILKQAKEAARSGGTHAFVVHSEFTTCMEHSAVSSKPCSVSQASAGRASLSLQQMPVSTSSAVSLVNHATHAAAFVDACQRNSGEKKSDCRDSSENVPSCVPPSLLDSRADSGSQKSNSGEDPVVAKMNPVNTTEGPERQSSPQDACLGTSVSNAVSVPSMGDKSVLPSQGSCADSCVVSSSATCNQANCSRQNQTVNMDKTKEMVPPNQILDIPFTKNDVLSVVSVTDGLMEKPVSVNLLTSFRMSVSDASTTVHAFPVNFQSDPTIPSTVVTSPSPLLPAVSSQVNHENANYRPEQSDDTFSLACLNPLYGRHSSYSPSHMPVPTSSCEQNFQTPYASVMRSSQEFLHREQEQNIQKGLTDSYSHPSTGAEFQFSSAVECQQVVSSFTSSCEARIVSDSIQSNRCPWLLPGVPTKQSKTSQQQLSNTLPDSDGSDPAGTNQVESEYVTRSVIQSGSRNNMQPMCLPEHSSNASQSSAVQNMSQCDQAAENTVSSSDSLAVHGMLLTVANQPITESVNDTHQTMNLKENECNAQRSYSPINPNAQLSYSPISPASCRSPVYMPISPPSSPLPNIPVRAFSPITPPLAHRPAVATAATLQPLDLSSTQQTDHLEVNKTCAEQGGVFVSSSAVSTPASPFSSQPHGVDCNTAPLDSSLKQIIPDGSLPASGSDYFVKFHSSYACLQCVKRFKEKEAFYEHVWVHLHPEGQVCDKCSNIAEKLCLKTSEIVDSVSSIVDRKLISRLTKDCRKKLQSKLEGDVMPLGRTKTETEASVSERDLHVQPSPSSSVPQIQTAETVHSDVADSTHQTVMSDVTDSVHQTVRSDVTDSVHQTVRSDVTDSVHQTIRSDVTDSVHQTVRSDVTDSVHQTVRSDVADSTHQTAQSDVADSTHQTAQSDVADSTHQTAQSDVADSVHQTAQSDVADSTHEPKVPSVMPCPAAEDISTDLQTEAGTHQISTDLQTEAGTYQKDGELADYVEQISRQVPVPCSLSPVREKQTEAESVLTGEHSVASKSFDQEPDSDQSDQVLQDMRPEDNSCHTPPDRTENISNSGYESGEGSNSEAEDSSHTSGGETVEAQQQGDREGDHCGEQGTSEAGSRDVNHNAENGEPGPSSCSRRSKDNEQSVYSTPGKEGGKPHSAGTGKLDRCSVFYICSLCNFSCDTAVEFTIHLNSEHVQNEEYFCYHCNYRGEYTTDLTNHVNAHTTGEANIYRCPCALESCSYRTDSLHNMRQHLATHKDSQAFRCDTCQSCFNDGIEFLHHAQQNSLTLYTCSQCASRFLEKSAIQHHWRTKHSGGLVFRVFKILLCHDRKVNGYQSSQASDNDVTKPVESHPSTSHSVQPLSAPAPDAGSSASENLEISSAVKSVSENQTSDTKSPSDSVVRTDKPSGSVLDMDSDVCASEKEQEAAVHEPEDTTVSNTDVPLTENSPEPSETRRPEDENNKFVVMTIADPEVSDSSHSVICGELETEGTKQNRNQLDHLEKPTAGTATRLSGTIHLLMADGQVIESKGLDSCKKEMSNNAENDAICVSEVQAECKLSCHEDLMVCGYEVSSAVDTPNQITQTAASLPEPHCHRNTHLSSAEASEGNVMVMEEVPEQDIKLTELFGSDELHHAMSDHLYHESSGHFCCAICDKNFERCERIHEHLFTHFHVPLFSCCFCTHSSCSRRDIRRHHAALHPEEEEQMKCLTVYRSQLLEVLEQERPLTTQKFKRICDELKHDRFSCSSESGNNNNSGGGAEAVTIHRAKDVGSESAATRVTSHSQGDLRDCISKKSDSSSISKKTDPSSVLKKSYPSSVSKKSYPSSVSKKSDPSAFKKNDPSSVNKKSKPSASKKRDPTSVSKKSDPSSVSRKSCPPVDNKSDPLVNKKCDPPVDNKSDPPVSKKSSTSFPKKSDSSSLSRKGDTGRTNSAGRMENSTSAVEAEVINRTGHVKNKHADTSVTHSSVKQRHNISKKSYPSSGAVVHSNRTEKQSAVLEDTVTLASNGHAQCGVKSFNRATSVHRRKSAEEKGSRDSGGCFSSGAAKESRNVRLLAAKPHSSAHYMQKSLQNCKMKGKTPAPPMKDRKFTVVKSGAVIQLKCKACGKTTLSQKAMFKHVEEACQRYMNAQPVSEHTNAAGSLAKKMRTSGSALGAGYFTSLNSKTGQEQSEEPGSVESDCCAQDSSNPESSPGSSEQPRISEKPLKRSSLKKPRSEKKVQESSSEKGKKDRMTVGPHAKKTKLVKTAMKETGDERSADGGVSPEPNKNIDESVRMKNVEDNHTPEETDHQHVKSADDRSDVEMSEEDIKPRRSRKRRCTWRLESSSDEYDSEDQVDSKRDVEKSEEEEIKDDFEQLSECKLCGFAAPSSQVHELKNHLHSKHQRLMSLIKCGHCGQPYGNLTILKRHINSIHPGQPELQEQVPYHEFFKLQEKENCSPQKRLEQLVNRIRSEPRIKQRRVQKGSGSGLITASGIDKKNSANDSENCEEKNTSISLSIDAPGKPEEALSNLVPEDSCRNASCSGQMESTVGNSPKQTDHIILCSSEEDDISHQDADIVPKHQGQQGHGKVRKFPVLDSEEFRTFLKSKSLSQCPVSVPSGPKDAAGMRSDSASKPDLSLSERKDAVESGVPVSQGQASAQKCKPQGSLDSERCIRDGKNIKTRYRCVKCSQVQPDYRSMFLHLSRHLDYSPLRCDLCFMEFITTREAHVHYSKMHPGKSAPDSWVCDAMAEEELLALIKASQVESSPSCEADEQELPGQKGERRKQSIQCYLCQALFDSLDQFRNHSMKDHGIENDSSKMHWQDSQSQTVYDLGGNIVQASVLEPVVFNKLCGYCSWRFVNSEAAASHSRAKHPDRKYMWIVMLRCGVNCLMKNLPTQAESLVSATTGQKETSEMQRCGTSSESSGNGSPDAGEVAGEAGNGLQGRGLSCPKLKEGPAIVLKDFLKTHQILGFKRLLQSNGITAFHLGERLSPEAQAFLMRFAPE